MLRKRARTTTKALQKVIEAVDDGLSIRKASKTYNIRFSTLQGRIKMNLPATEGHSNFSLEKNLCKNSG